MLVPFVGYILFGLANIYLFSLAIKQIPTATAFAVWTAITLIFIKIAEQRKGLWRWLLFATHPSLYYLPFNGSVWRLQQQPNFLGSQRAVPEDLLYVDEKAVLADTTPQEFELVMQSGRIREEARRKAEGL